jgi:hypothetical protein
MKENSELLKNYSAVQSTKFIKDQLPNIEIDDYYAPGKIDK